VLLGGDDPSRPPLRGRWGPATTEVPALQEAALHHLPAEESSWLPTGRNIFLAPRETEDLELRPLVPPPFPGLPHPGLSLLLSLSPGLSARLRHPMRSDPGAAAAAPRREVAGGTRGEEGPGDPETLLEVDRSAVGMTISERIRLSQEERIRRAEADRRARMAEEERRRSLDRVTWMNGTVAAGEVVEFDRKGPDRYQIKLEIDRVRGDILLSEEERRRRLEPLKLVFREDRGPGRPRGRATITAAQVQAIEFAPTVRNQYGLRRHQLAPDDRAGHEDLASYLVTSGELGLAESHLEGMRARGLFAPSTAALLSDVYRRLFRYGRELSLLEESLAGSPGEPGLLARKGQLLIRLGLPVEAGRAFAAAAAKDPVHAGAQLGLGEVALLEGDAAQALAHLRRVEAGSGLDRDQHAHALVLFGRAWLRQGDSATAESYFSRALDRTPGNPRALEGLAVTAFLSRGAPAAAPVVDRSLADRPQDGRLHYLRGVLDLLLGRYAEARDHLQAAMEFDPLLTAEARTGLSYLFEVGGRVESALSEVRQAVDADPLCLGAVWQRARLLLQVSDLDGARQDLLTVLEREPARADVLVALGDVSFRLGNPVEAARFYVRAEGIEPRFPGLHGRRLITEVRRRRLADAEALVKAIPAGEEKDPHLELAQAYFHYSREKTEETLRRLRLVVERTDPKPEPGVLAWAAGALAQIEDNLNKEVWRDGFNRQGQILRGWKRVLSRGVSVGLEEGRLVFAGTQREISDEPTVLYQERPARQFSSFVLDLDAPAQPGVAAGIGLVAFHPSAREPEPYPGMQRRDNRLVAFLGLQVARLPHGKLGFRTIQQGKATEWQDLGGPAEAPSGPFSLGIELEDAQKSTYRVLVDQVPARTGIEVAGLSRRPGTIEIQVFVQAQVDKPLKLVADNATLITLKKP
jgi:tetratricopeptide (TPR) repeat protein